MRVTAVRYHDSDNWPAHPPVGMWFNYGVLNDFMKEWLLRKEELKSGKITRDEYFEWKLTGHRPVMGVGNMSRKGNGDLQMQNLVKLSKT